MTERFVISQSFSVSDNLEKSQKRNRDVFLTVRSLNYRSSERQVEKKFNSGDPLSKSDLIFLSVCL